MKELINKIFRFFGFEIKKYDKEKTRGVFFHNDYGYSMGFELEKEANEKIQLIRKNTMLPYVNLISLYEQCVYFEKKQIEGDYVECGVWKGGSIGLMALANLKYGKERRKLHLFDSFEGICFPEEEKDGDKAINEVKPFLRGNEIINGKLETIKGFYDTLGGNGKIEENANLLELKIKYPREYIYYHKGWFQDTIPSERNQIDKIAILRLDGDWYASTKVSLENLYDKVVTGGFIIIDDYGCYEGCKKAVDEFFLERGISAYLNYSNPSCRYWIKNC